MSEDEYLWDEIPYTGYIALGRRGMESIKLTQCFIPDCDNQDIKKLHPIDVEEQEDDMKTVKTFTIHCDECSKDFKLSFETIKKVAKRVGVSEESGDADIRSMGLIYVIDDKGTEYHLGYF